jgi:2-polyprenyl-6-methoxyphenol hydroxylase-like FAD-dependent oxidoreductase
MIYTAYPIGRFKAVRADIEGQFWKTMNQIPSMTDRLKAGRQAERFYGSADLPAFYRVPFGPGWALAGDAGLTMDPISGQGIGNAFLDAERLAEAVNAGFSGRQPLETALAGYQRERDERTLPTFKFTSQLAGFEPPTVETQAMFAALAKKPEAADRFFGMLTGTVPVAEFFSPSNLFRILGPLGMGRIMLNKLDRQRKVSRCPRFKGPTHNRQI